MGIRPTAAGVCLALALGLSSAGQPAPPADAARVKALVGQLGSDSFDEREHARKELEAIGHPALPALRAALKTTDLETSRRAAELIRRIEEKALSAQLLAPKKLRFKAQGQPVLEAVAALAKQSGYAIRVDGDRTLLTGKKVTLDTGEVTFWEAVDRLGAQAGLAEKLTVAAQWLDPNGPPPGPSKMPMVLRIPLGEPAAKKMPARPPVPPLKLVPLPKPAPKDDKEKKPAEEPPPEPAKGVAVAGNAEPPVTPVTPGLVILAPGEIKPQAVSYAGAVRVVLKGAKPQPGVKLPSPEKFHDLMLEASAEPRLLGFTVAGAPTITRAVDDHSQALAFIIDPVAAQPPKLPPGVTADLVDFLDLNMPTGGPAPRGVIVRLQRGEKPAKKLRELAGSLTAHVLVPDATLAVVEDALKAAGRSVDLKGGGHLKVEAVTRTPEGDYQLTLKLEDLPGGPGVAGSSVDARGKLSVTSNGTGVPVSWEGLVDLADAQGRKLGMVVTPTLNPEPGDEGTPTTRLTVTAVFRRDLGQGEPTRLALTGTQYVVVVVPFRFTDVPLP
jgi:hypothetical protein